MSQGNFQYSKNLYMKKKKKTEFKLNKAEVIDDLDLGSASELIKARDRLNSMVDELNIKIAEIGIKEALKEAKFNNESIKDRIVGPNSVFMLDKIYPNVARASDKSIAMDMGLVAGGIKVKSIRVDKEGNVATKS